MSINFNMHEGPSIKALPLHRLSVEPTRNHFLTCFLTLLSLQIGTHVPREGWLFKQDQNILNIRNIVTNQ